MPADTPTVAASVPTSLPERIVSLLPSATEILFALDVGDRVVGVTFECDHPAEARQRRIVSTTSIPAGLEPAAIDALVKEHTAAGVDLYHLERDALRELDPDLVLTQDLCAVCAIDVDEVDDAMTHLGCRAEVVTLDPMTLDEVLGSIHTVGAAVGATERAAELVGALRARLHRLAARLDGTETVPTLVLEWTDPAFTAGHWVPDLIVAAGGTAVLGAPGRRSCGIEWAAIREAVADVVLIAPCGFGLDGAAQLGERLLEGDRLPADSAVWAIDADALVVRPGPRLVDGVEVIAGILHPDRVDAPTRPLAIRLR